MTRMNLNVISTLVGVKEFKIENSGLSIFPNPAKEILYIKNENPEQTKIKVELFNSLGQIVMRIDNVSGSRNVDVSHLKPGIYFIIFVSSEKTWSAKIIKE